MPFASDQPLSISQVDEDNWCLNNDMAYYESAYTDDTIIIPKGFTCDGSSIPRPVWSIVGHPLHGHHAPVGFLHDWVLRSGMFVRRKPCDLIYLEAHKSLGTNFFLRHICYRSIRIFSIICFGDKINEDAYDDDDFMGGLGSFGFS